MPNRLKPKEVMCPHCGAESGENCFTPSGKTLRPLGVSHCKRVLATKNAEAIETVMTDERSQHQMQALPYVRFDAHAKLPKKLAFKVCDRHHVWCDHHGAVHPATPDYFDEGSKDCYPANWRRVYIESDDKNEAF